MDSVIIEKLEAIKKRYKNQMPLLQKFSHLLFSLLSLGLFLSSPLWLPSSLSMLKEVGGIAFGPKGLFVVCNIIIVVLFGESRLYKSSVQPDIYEEYANRNRSNQKLSGCEDYNEEEYEVQRRRRRRRRRELQVEDDEEEEEEEEEKIGEKGLDELNKRVEDFIARVNKQRKLEARLIDCYG